MTANEAIWIAAIFSIMNFAIISVLLVKFYYKIRTEIHKNILKNSTYTLLEMSIWDLKRDKKDLEVKLDEAMSDSLRAHNSMKVMANKLVDNGR